MNAIVSILFLALYHARNVRSDFSCDNVEYTFINETRRSSAYKSSAPYICDRGFIEDDKWYRFHSESGNKMPTSNPGLLRCGTYVPIWFDGTHPTVENDVKDARACAAIPFILPPGCGVSYNIKVVKCPGDFYLYRLKEPQQCSLAYCAGTKLPQQCTHHPGTNIPLCPDAFPFVEKIVANPNNDGEENIQLNCSWVYNGNSSLVEFKVRWIGDKKDPVRRIEHDFDGKDKREFFYDFLWSDGKGGFLDFQTQAPSPHGYKFNEEVYCEIQARYKGTAAKWSGWKQSNTIFTGISVFPQHVTLNECGHDKHITITLRPYLPINVRPFKFEIYPEDNEFVNEICVRGKISNDPHNPRCETQLRTSNSFYKPLHIKLLASCKQTVQNTNQRNVATFKFHQQIFGETNRFWSSYQFPAINVTVNRNKDKQICHSVTDPHFSTFDKKTYDFMGIGTFLLYRNKASGTQVQTRQKSCGGGFASCNCGVAIKEGFFFQIFDMCQAGEASKGKTAWWENPKNLITKSRQMANSLKDGYNTTKTPFGNEMHYKTTLPSGVVVTVKRRRWGLSTYVKAPRPIMDEQHDIDGLCGNFNGNSNDDFGGKSLEEFAKSNKIDDEDSIFHYSGDNEGEDTIHEECLNEELCVCKQGQSFCDDKAARICFPEVFTDDNGRRLHKLTEGLCGKEPTNKRRGKRDLFSPDDTVDDQDDIPSFNPPNIPISSPTWPTPNGLTEAEVRDICIKKIRNSKGGQNCGTVTGVNLNNVVENCILDIKATDDISWATDNFAAMETSCKKNILTNATYYKNNTDGEFEVATEIFEYLCPSDCSNHGNCSNATCICDEDYTAPDCSVSLKDRPFVFDIRKAGLCDVRKRPCRNVGIYAFPLVASGDLTCHIAEYRVIDSAWTPSNATVLYPGLQVAFAEVKCSLPASPVNLGDYDNVGVSAAGLRIGISNNRINISENSMLFITYDSVCQDCNTSTGCKFKNNSCLIFGHCFAQNESHPTDWCQQCLPNISTTSWQERQDNLPPIFTNAAVFHAFHRKQLRVQLNAVDPENRKIHYHFAQDETFGASLTENGLFTWTKNTTESTVFHINVTDECGAHSVFNVSVVIKTCPCQNSGECFPDYRYLDGSGNFICSCPAEYFGTLCELDVDECDVSKPCQNGTCTNERPGFFCTCFAGYIGNLCETEVDECVPNPCFHDIPCKDMIATFSCGPCPRGYTGNGINCTREFGPCDSNPNVCHINGECLQRNGSFVCQCIKGFIGDGYINCTDVDECVNTTEKCNKNANCTNVEGSYSCACQEGFVGDGRHNCSDINECVKTPDVCHKNSTCINIEGNYTCECPDGFTGDGYHECFDVDECVNATEKCNKNANCTNVEGSYSCACQEGFVGDGRHNCSDINECVKTPDVCHKNATCINIEGNYTCECPGGFTGDGYHECFENKAPLIKTPSLIYAILNMDFKIQIEARDPEDEDLVFELMKNGTATTAEITENGLLTITELKESASVYILVKDKKGAQNFLVLNVKAMQCPCKQEGKCQKKQNITYPVQKSDYICHCKEPFTGEKCEKRSSPCSEQPCFPGLKCSSALNSEGYTCEKCPPLFKGDGKYCELNNVKEKNHVESKITLKSEKWVDQLTDNTSKEYRELASRITIEIRTIYNNVPEFSYLIVKNFRTGSIIVNFVLIFSDEVKAPLEPLLKVAETGKLGNMTFEMNVNEHDADDEKNGSSDKTIRNAVIIAGVVVVVLFLIIVIVLRVRRQRKHREEKLRKKQRAEISRSQPKGISYHGKAGEEIDMKEMAGDLNIEP